MKKLLLMALAMTCLWTTTHAQVGINTTNPNPGTILDINADNKGILIPRVYIDDHSSGTQIEGGTTNGLLVYNTNQDTGEGFYYWYNTQWIPMGSEFSWRLTGNSGVNPETNFIGTVTNDPLAFRTNNVERMRVTSTGVVGIGTATPEIGTVVDEITRLNVSGDVTTLGHAVAEFNITGGDGFGLIVNSEAGNSMNALVSQYNGTTNYHSIFGLYIATTGEGIAVRGSANSSDAIGVMGSIPTSGDWSGFGGLFTGGLGYAHGIYNLSDKNVKKDIKSITNALSKIKELKGISYKYDPNVLKSAKEDERIYLGFIAQDVEQVLPEVVVSKNFPMGGGEIKITDKNDNLKEVKVVDYVAIVPVLVEAIKEQQEIIENQEARIAKLETLVQQLLDK